jgi:hypothetical protein
MVDIGPGPGDADGLLALVDRLGAAGADRPAARAHDRVRRAVGDGAPPAGLRHIAEGLTSAGADEPPPPRAADVPGCDDASAVAAAVRNTPLLVLDDAEPDEIATIVGELVGDGCRVIVTAADTAALDAVRTALPAAVGDRVVDALPTLAPADLRRLRGLLATSTPGRRARPAQGLPDPAALPNVAEVAELCAVAVRRSPPSTERIAAVLADLDDERRETVTSLSRCLLYALSVLDKRGEPWTRQLLADLVHGRRRSAFERLVQSTAQALATVDDGRDDPPVRVLAPLPPRAIDTLVSYLDYRESGGRARSYFRTAAQRDAAPVLRLLRLGGREPETSKDLRMVLTHFELGARLAAVDAECAEVGLPAPQNPDQLSSLSAALVEVAAAVRSVGALRHDVLFLHPGSPLAVPDMAAAEQLAAAVVDYAENGSAASAAVRLDGMADALAALAPPLDAAPEHGRGVTALRARNAAGYAAAVEELVSAQHELRDEQRTAALLAELGSPSLAQAWTPADGDDAVRTGLAWLTGADQLLEELPPPDRADVVVVLDAGGLGMDRALLAAAAPRVVAAVAPGRREGGLLELMQLASAPVIRGRSADPASRVVPLTPGEGPEPEPGETEPDEARPGEVEQAGA